ncbi:MAG: M16 family metallopeptidase [Bacteroidota bacterium]
MKKTNLFYILLVLLLAACTPKAGENTSAVSTAPVGSSPKIPLPSGDVRKQAPVAGDAPKIQIGKAETFKLSNGLTVILVENHKLPTVSFRLFVDMDPVLEKEAAGYTNFLGELLTAGTKTRSKAQINQEIDFIGASLSADQNGVSGSCLTKHTDKLLEIMADALLRPTFPQEELDKAKVRTLSDLASQKDDAGAIASVVGSVVRYGSNHPYGENMSEASVEKVTLEQIKSHYNTYFKPNISYLVVTGDITRTKLEDYSKQYFGRWASGKVPEHSYPTPKAPEKAQVDFVHKPGAVQSVINITYPIDLKPGAPEVIKARVANTILGGYFNSRVNANLREGHGWTYGARSSLSPDELVGFFNGTASVRNAVTDSSLTEFIREMRRLATEKVPEQELQVVKNVIAGQFSQNLEEPGTIASFALSTIRYSLPADYYEKYLEALQSVTADDVMAMAKKYINPDKAHILVVGNRDAVADKLKQFSPDGKMNFFDAYGNPVKAASQVVPDGMTGFKVVEDYLNAIGGPGKIGAISDMQTEASMQVRGPAMTVKTWQKANSRLAVEISMNGQTLNRQVYSDGKGSQSGMGGNAPMEGAQLEDSKEQARFVKEAFYASAGYKLNLKGIEEVSGENAYIVEVERPDGKKSTEYYSTKTSLKLREIASSEGPDGSPMTQTIDFSDYKGVAGVLFPHSTTVTGVFPVPFKVTLTSVKVNEGIDESIFKL